MAIACIGAFASTAAAASPADWLYEPTTFAEIKLEIPPTSYQKLEAEPKGAYQPATFSVAETDGTPESAGPFSAPIQIGVKLKGKASIRSIDEKAAFKIKFDSVIKKQTYLGLEKMTLNNMIQDPSMVHEALAYDAFHRMGVPAPHVGFAYVTVNGKSYGLHLDIETADEVSMGKLFGVPFDKSTQHVYEGEYGADVSAAIYPGGGERWKRFEVDEGDEEDEGDLEALLAAVEGSSGSFSQRVGGLADLPEMTRMWLTEKYVGHWDSYTGLSPNEYQPNNYYLYSDPTGKFSMMPSGADQTWSDHPGFGPPGGRLFEGCLADSAGCRPLYRSAGEAALTALRAASLDREARCLAAAVDPWLKYEDGVSEDDKKPDYTVEEAEDAQETMREFVSERPAELASYLGVAAPPKTSDASECAPLRPVGGFQPPPEPPAPAEPSSSGAAGSSASGSSAGPAAGSSGLAPAPPPALKLSRRSVTGGTVDLRVHVSGPGSVRLVGSYRIGTGRRTTACRGRATATTAGVLEAHCKLTAGFRRLLSVHGHAVRVAVTLTTAGGRTTSSFELNLPRR